MLGDSKGKPNIWLIRHGLSVFNYWSRTYGHRAAEYGNLGSTEKDPDYAYLQEIKDKLDIHLADPSLHKKGLAQAIKAQASVNKMNVKYVFVSPLSRTLETCKNLFATYPDKENVHFVVHPVVRELMGSPCDVPVDTLKDKRAEYEALGYDFGMLDKFEKKDLFFLYSMNSPEREELFEEIEKNQDKHYVQVIADVIKRKKNEAKKGNRKIESFVNARQRAVNFAEFLVNFIPSAGLKEGEDIVIVTHSLFISYSTATYWTPDGSISVGNIPHCEPIEFNYNWILQLKEDFSTRNVFVMAMLKLVPQLKSALEAQTAAVEVQKVDKCKRNHRLHFARVPIGTYICAHCKKLSDSSGGRWHCIMCDENVCLNCCSSSVPDEATKGKMCDYGHRMKLTAHEYPWQYYRCKTCGTEDEAKKVRWNCPYCTYDVCVNCKPVSV